MSDIFTINIEEVPQNFTVALQEASDGASGANGISPQLRATGTALEVSGASGWQPLIELSTLPFLPTTGGIVYGDVNVSQNLAVVGVSNFYGQAFLEGQTASSGTSALNRDLGDARYLRSGQSGLVAQLSFSSGSTGSPFLTWGDSDCGFYGVDSKSIGYVYDGIQKFRFDAGGFVVSSAGGAATRTFTVFDGSTQSFTAGLNSSNSQCFGFGDLLNASSLGRFERNTSNGLIEWKSQAASSASLGFVIGHASASNYDKAATGQTANVREFRNSSNSAMCAVGRSGEFKPAVLADANASTGSLYYSTNALKLVFKDASGIVQALY